MSEGTSTGSDRSEGYQRLQLLVRERDDLVDQRRKEENRLHAHHHRVVPPEALVQLAHQRIAFLTQQVKQLETLIHDLCNEEDLRNSFAVLSSVPGIGPVTASVLLAETQGFSGFKHVKQVTAYAGIAPAPFQSGAYTGRTRISKVGNARLRQALYMAALQASRQAGVFKNLFDRLIAKNKPRKLALIAVARKILVVAFTLIKRQQTFNPHHPCALSKAAA